MDPRQPGSATLFCSLNGDLPPFLGVAWFGDTVPREDRVNVGDTGFGHLLNEQVHGLAFEDRLEEPDAKAGLSFLPDVFNQE